MLEVLNAILNVNTAVCRAITVVMPMAAVSANVVSAVEGSGVTTAAQNAAISGVEKIASSMIDALGAVMPIATQLGPDAVASVKASIADLQATGNLTAEQMTVSAALDARADAAFDDAAKAAGV